MKIALFGASGMVGSRILNEALSRGHQVTGIVRNPEKITTQHALLTVKQGTALDAAHVAQLVAGHGIVITAIVDRSADYANTVKATHAVLSGLRQAGVKRLITVGGAGSLEVAPGVALVDTPQFPAEYRPESSAARDALNVHRTVTDLDWTYVSPSIVIMPGERTGKFRVGGDQVLFDAQGNSQISAEDFAVAILDEVEKPQHIQQRFTVGY